MKELYIGLMSGTSADAIDAALVDFSNHFPKLVTTHKSYLPTELRLDLNKLGEEGAVKILQLGALDVRMGHAFADTVKALLRKTSLLTRDVLAIGSHGQTVFHFPQYHYPFTMQIGDPNIIAEETNITTVADFRRRDIAAGGQGAPLTPAFHNFIFRSKKEDRIVLNLGGFANITYLPADPKAPVIGFDVGPANLLMDKWIYRHRKQWFDVDGSWAASAVFDEGLLQQFLSDPYFFLEPPKSTGHDYFNLVWLEQQLDRWNKSLQPSVVQATLCEMTAASIGTAIQQLDSTCGSILLCGGGSKNTYLKERLAYRCPGRHLRLCDDLGVPAEWMEAMAFSWFAKQTLEGKTCNLPEVTGARNLTVLGGIYLKAPL